MAFLTANGTPCSKAVVVLPRIGAWHADLVIDDTDPSSYEGQVTLAMGAGRVVLNGSSVSGRVDEQYGVVMTRVVGGFGGLGNNLQPKAYRNAAVSLVLNDICQDAGEVMSPLCDPATVQTILPFWSRFYGTAGRAIQALMGKSGSAWRVLFDGSIFCGPESWSPSPMKNYEVVNEIPQEGSIEFSADVPNVRPGETLGGQAVSRIEHRVEADKLRSQVWFED